MGQVMIKHTEFQLLLQQKILLSGNYSIEEVARGIDMPKKTLYHHIEGRSTYPVDKVGILYSVTKDPAFLDFVVKDTDMMIAPRQQGEEGKSVMDETLDIAAELGNVVTLVRDALVDSDVDVKEKARVVEAINKAQKELEELRLSLRDGGNKKIIVKVG